MSFSLSLLLPLKEILVSYNTGLVVIVSAIVFIANSNCTLIQFIVVIWECSDVNKRIKRKMLLSIQAKLQTIQILNKQQSNGKDFFSYCTHLCLCISVGL